MTLEDRIFANERAQYVRVRIGGILIFDLPRDGNGISIADVRYYESFDQPCPVVTLKTDNLPTWVKNGDTVTVDLGYDGLGRRVFTGTVQPRNQPDIAVGQPECAGEMWKVVRDVQVDGRDVGGLTVAAALAAVLDDLNIASYDLSAVPGYTLAVDAALQPGTGMMQITELMKIDGLRIMETGTGQIRVARYEGLPAVAAFRKYSTTETANMRILKGGVREDLTFYRSQVTVLGATLADGTTISATATLADTSLARPPLKAGIHIADTYSIPLIWEVDKAEEASIRIGSERARIPVAFRMRIPMDPELEIGMTLEIDAPEWNVAGLWIIWGLAHNAAADTTEVELRGGDQFGGTPSLNPHAEFGFTVEYQVFGTQTYAFVTLDASGSFQGDNANEVLTYTWSDDEGAGATSPNIDGETDAIITIRVDPTQVTGTWDVTLLVTNEAGLTSTVTWAIDITPDGPHALVASIGAALDNQFSASPDGAQTWNDQAGTNVGLVAQCPPDGQHLGYIVYSAGAGGDELYLTTNACATAPALVQAAVGSPFVDLEWDWRDPSKVWALTANCELYLSSDYGLTWSLLVNVRTQLPLATATGRKLGLPAAGGTWMFGGNGVVGDGRPLIAYLSAGVLSGIAGAYGGELAADLGSGEDDLTIADSIDMGGGLCIILENYDASDSGVRPIYYTTSPFAPGDWKRATGLDAAMTVDGRVMLPGNSGIQHFHAMFADRNVWHIDASTGVPVCTKEADVLDAGYTPNNGIWLRDEAQGLATAMVYLLAIEDAGANGMIAKSWDDMVSVGPVRPATGYPAWPASSLGKDVGVGRASAEGGPARVLIAADEFVGNDNFAAWRVGGPSFTNEIFVDASAHNFQKVRVITDQLWFLLYMFSDSARDGVSTYRTKDGGATWDEFYAPPTAGRSWQDFQRDAAGRLWGLTCEDANQDHMEIWVSDDEGDTWDESHDHDSNLSKYPAHIACHPTNPLRIAVWCRAGAINRDHTVFYTLDGGATWANNNVVDISFGAAIHSIGFRMLANNRLVLGGWDLYESQEATIWTSDDNGASWDIRKKFYDVVFAAGFENIWGPVGDAMGTKLFVMVMAAEPGDFDTQIWKSVDSGQTWEMIVGTALGNHPPQVVGTDMWDAGISYDAANDALVICGEKQTGGINAVLRYSPTNDAGSWQDLTDELGPSPLVIRWQPTTYGIAVIP